VPLHVTRISQSHSTHRPANGNGVVAHQLLKKKSISPWCVTPTPFLFPILLPFANNIQQQQHQQGKKVKVNKLYVRGGGGLESRQMYNG